MSEWRKSNLVWVECQICGSPMKVPKSRANKPRTHMCDECYRMYKRRRSYSRTPTLRLSPLGKKQLKEFVQFVHTDRKNRLTRTDIEKWLGAFLRGYETKSRVRRFINWLKRNKAIRKSPKGYKLNLKDLKYRQWRQESDHLYGVSWIGESKK